MHTACWGPNRPWLAIGITMGQRTHCVRVLDEQGRIVAHLGTEERPEHVIWATSHAFLVALTADSCHVWNTNDWTVVSTLTLTGKSDGSERRGFAAACISHVHPFLFYARHGSRFIMSLDLTTMKALPRMDNGAKKFVTALVAHPEKPLLASGHADYAVRMWDYQLGTYRGSDEYAAIAASGRVTLGSNTGITMLAMHPTQDTVACASSSGLVIVMRSSAGRVLRVVAARVLNATARGGRDEAGFLTGLSWTRAGLRSCTSLGR